MEVASPLAKREMLVAAPSQLSVCAEPFRAKISGARSDTMIRLFDYLLARSEQGQAPKEIEIFHAIFARADGEFNNHDSAVRTYIHRLRQKLDDFYSGCDGHRLIIPKGEYRFVLIDNDKAKADAEGDAPTLPAPTPSASFFNRYLKLGLAVFLGLIGFVALISFLSGSPQMSARIENSILWRPIAVGHRPLIVAIGDYYLIGKSVDGRRVTHLLRDFSINSRDDLDQYLMNHPEDGGRYMDVGLSYFPTSVGPGLESLVPVVKTLTARRNRTSSTRALSTVDADALGRADIVYVGLLSGLGKLRNPVFGASGYTIGTSYEEIIDRKTRKAYFASRNMFDDGNAPQVDYGYIASIPGPAANRILVISGTRDVAATAMTRLAADPDQMRVLEERVKNAPNFEALYEVRSIGNTVAQVNLADGRLITKKDIWTDDGDEQMFPDSNPPTAPLEAAPET